MKPSIDWQHTDIDSFEALTGDLIREAAELIRPYVPASSISEIERKNGDRILAKFEDENPTGAFKVRGGLVYFDWLKTIHPETESVMAATRGNHGQSVAFAAGNVGVSAKVVVPFGNSTSKNEAMRQLGAEVIEQGRDFAEAMEFAISEARSTGNHLVPSFDWKLVLGVATYGFELFSERSDVDAVYVPIGLGSGVCGTIAARNAIGSSAKIIGVVAENAPVYADAFATGKWCISSEPPETIADGVAARVPSEDSFSVIRRYVDEIVSVPEPHIRDAIRELYELTGKRIEGAGAIGYAAWASDENNRFRNPAVIISGGNIDDAVFDGIVRSQEHR